jgi:hypothetical protein
MKPILFLFIALLTITTSINSQALTFKTTTTASTGYDVNLGTDTATDITLFGTTYDVFKTAKGAQYIKLMSSKGSEYAKWIGIETTNVHEGLPVRQFTGSGSYFVFYLTPKGSPHYRMLELDTK